MNSLKLLVMPVIVAEAILCSGHIWALGPALKDVEPEPLVAVSHAYSPDREAFENGWKRFPQEMAFNEASKLEVPETCFLRYESARHHLRTILFKASRNTFVSLTHFDSPSARPDLLVLLHQPEALTPETLKQYLEYLSLGMETGAVFPGYPLTHEGGIDLEIAERDLDPNISRLILPFVRMPGHEFPHMPGLEKMPPLESKPRKQP